MKGKYTTLTTITILLLTISANSFFSPTSAQTRPIPVLLIHGYFSDASVWRIWEELLETDRIPYKSITFTQSDDGCGSARDHAMELNQIVEDFMAETRAERINIVAHSKGGLDARAYLANDLSNDAIANLIMIGTPNAGSPLANLNDFCQPAIFDLRPRSAATNVSVNNNTNYHTIAGDWIPSRTFWTFIDSNCTPEEQDWLAFQQWGSSRLAGHDDGIVPLSSVHSQGFNSLGNTDNCHTDLLSLEEYKKARGVLLFGSE
jgi:pimeloyl-ACP methyl ester carboxylesterase